jgi:hypothetical protein
MFYTSLIRQFKLVIHRNGYIYRQVKLKDYINTLRKLINGRMHVHP